jgi:cytoskeleton protein RodZ
MSENVTATSQFASIGSELRISREKAGLSLEDVSAQLRISVRHLENIESGDRDRLPGSTYLLGFVRSYAKLLKLNADDMCQRIMDAMTEADFKPELHVVGGGVSPTDYRTRYIMAGVVLVILAYSGWYLLRSDTISTSGFLSVEESPEETETPSVSSSVSNEVEAGVTIIPETPSETATPEPVENIQEGSNTAQINPQVETVSSDADSDDVSANDNAMSQIMIKATSSTWIELKTEAEETVVAKLLLADEMINIPDDGVYTLTTGNAGGLLIGYQGDDASWKTLGVNGEILKMKAIDNSLLKD